MGYRVTARVMVSQNPPSESCAPLRENRERNGMVRKSTRGPSSASKAGKSVRVAARAAITTRMAPSPSDWKNDTGTMNIPISAITTVVPLKSTVRPAVSPALTTASYLSRPRLSSSLKRDTISSE